LKQVSLKGHVNFCINHKVPYLKVTKNLTNLAKKFCESPPRSIGRGGEGLEKRVRKINNRRKRRREEETNIEKG